MIDLFENPKALLAPDFDPYECSVLGIHVGAPASALDGWEAETNEYGWSHIQGGVAFKVGEGLVYQIKLPSTFIERLEVVNADDFIRELGPNDDMRRIAYRDQPPICGYLWNRGILVWWNLLSEIGLSHLVIFDPARGIPQDSTNVTYTLDSGEERHRDAPDTFELPSRTRRENLIEGDLVKLMFRIVIDEIDFVERMWVRVTDVRHGTYLGVLDNDAYSTNEIRSGMSVGFNADHVIQIWTETSK